MPADMKCLSDSHERIQICMSGVRPAHEVRLVAERHGDGMPDVLPENHRPASARDGRPEIYLNGHESGRTSHSDRGGECGGDARAHARKKFSPAGDYFYRFVLRRSGGLVCVPWKDFQVRRRARRARAIPTSKARQAAATAQTRRRRTAGK